MNDKLWFSSYDSEVPTHIEYPEMTLVDIFNNSVKNYPASTCVVDRGKKYTYSEVSHEVASFARQLLSAGVRRGDRVGLILFNEYRFIIAYYGILQAGGIVVALNPFYKPNEMQELIVGAGVSMLVAYDGIGSYLPKTVKELRTVLFDLEDGLPNLVYSVTKTKGKVTEFKIESTVDQHKHIQTVDFPHLSPNDPAIFQFTGGTTGIPKTAIGSHKNIASNTRQFRSWLHPLRESEESILLAIPLYHVYGMVLGLNLGILLGARLVCCAIQGNMNKVAQLIQEENITVIPGVPSLYYGLCGSAADLGEPVRSKLKVCISGASALNTRIKDEFERIFGCPILEGYGLSEAPTATHCNPWDHKHKNDSIGLPLPDVDCQIVDAENGKTRKKIGESGELIIKGPQVMSGYFGSPTENQEIIRKGWLYTGDIARMDDEGYFFLLGRKKDVIKVSGFQVWPKEIEDVLLQYPGVKEAAVAGVPDVKQGEKVKAWIVKRTDAEVSKSGLIRLCAEKLISYKIPAEIIFIDSLPKSHVGKVLRRLLVQS